MLKLSWSFDTIVSTSSGIITPFTSIKLATDFVTDASLTTWVLSFLTDKTNVYLSSYFLR